LSSAANVMDALAKAGHTVVPIGITPAGRWLTGSDPWRQLSDHAQGRAHAALPHANGHATEIDATETDATETNAAGATGDSWALLPRPAQEGGLPAIDVIFPVLHGPYGEDGTVQGLLEMASIPYVGCGVLSSAVAMDKEVAKRLFTAAGLTQVNAHLILRPAWQVDPEAVLAEIEAALPAYPLFAKPANLGSSVGVSKARDRRELAAALNLACEFDRKILVEEAVPNAREIEVSVLGNDAPIASIPGEIVPGNEFYDYAAKYLDDSSRLIVPADLTPAQIAHVQDAALCAFRAVEASGLARVDFLLDDHSGVFYLNEINTMPGFTRISMYPRLWEASGIPYPQLVDRLVQLACERFEDRQRNRTTR
jgi:D-alanine-D-alanine ligase